MSDPNWKSRPALTEAQKRDLLRHMRVPFFTFVTLMLLLSVNAITGILQVFPDVWILNLGVLVAMVACVLLFSMEVIEEPSLVRLFSVLGFCWVGIMFAMTLVDYATRNAIY